MKSQSLKNSSKKSDMTKIPNPLFVLELANNHMGDTNHGIHVIQEFSKICGKFPYQFAFKLQYRNLESFVHPSMKGRMDLKYIKRFEETRLSRADFDILVRAIRENGFMAMCTPFDEASIPVIEEQKLDIIKVASCSFTDWPLLECIVKTDKPIIASTAGATLEEIDRVISFFTNRDKDFAIMHCVGEYPTPDEKMHLSQIDLLIKRYPNVRIGFSTHENPENIALVQLAVAKGACVFEKHVGVPTSNYPLNAYSCSPNQYFKWLEAFSYAMKVCGEGSQRLPLNENEQASLQSLRRGAFARNEIEAGQNISIEDLFFAFPPEEGQYTANDFSKYTSLTCTKKISVNQALHPDNCELNNSRSQILQIVQSVKDFLKKSNVVIPGRADLEISHHYGIERFVEIGLTLITVINREYCKKLLVTLPGQFHPEQYHEKKEETFHVLYGEVDLILNGESKKCGPGDVVTIEPGTKHAFRSESGCVIEEISSTHYTNDSFYTDPMIMKNTKRKTLLNHWME